MGELLTETVVDLVGGGIGFLGGLCGDREGGGVSAYIGGVSSVKIETSQQNTESMTIVNTAIPVTGAQFVRPLAVMPNGAAMAPTTMPISPLVPSPMLTAGAAMDPVSFQTWWNAVSQLNGSRPGTPLAALNPGPFARMGSPTLEQMQEFQQQQHQAQQQRQQQQAGGAARARCWLLSHSICQLQPA